MWGSWNSWSPCSTTCGYGTRERKRLCDNPKPAYDGKNCLGVGYQKRRCHAYYPCPSTFGFIKTRWFATNFNFFFRFFLLSQFTNRKVSVKIRSKQFYIYQSILPILLKFFKTKKIILLSFVSCRLFLSYKSGLTFYLR